MQLLYGAFFVLRASRGQADFDIKSLRKQAEAQYPIGL
jgi:hypothetical protein